jgi:hypothetical protein
VRSAIRPVHVRQCNTQLPGDEVRGFFRGGPRLSTAEEEGDAYLILDAKYRVDASADYRQTYGSPGPPEASLNSLYRYRDAILDATAHQEGITRPAHTVVQTAAAFPYVEAVEGDYRSSRLWQALESLGIGAVPMLPDNLGYLRDWLRSVLQRGGWALAERTIPHVAYEHVHQMRIAALEPVLIGTLKEGYQREHLEWIRAERLYYTRLPKTPSRHYTAKWVALYTPAFLGKEAAVSYESPIESLEIVPRSRILSPWAASHGPDELFVLYHLGPLSALSLVIKNVDGRRVRDHMWTSRLALKRARQLPELFLETELEWRLYEDLSAEGVDFRIFAGPVTPSDSVEPRGRAWFVMSDRTVVRYARGAGFLVRSPGSKDRYFANIEDALEALSQIQTQQEP